jgi:acyl-CoA synthetase (AMP-forming)/AMP-acid ligase II
VGLKLRQTIYLGFGGHNRSQYLLSWIIQHEIQITCLTPRQVFFLSQQLETSGLKSLALTIHCGGAPLEPLLKQRLSNFGVVIIEGYGLTEAGPGVLMDGRPIGCEVKLGQRHEIDSSIAELWVKSPTLGDFEQKTLDAEGFFATGDCARFVDGRYEIVGRLDEKIKKADGTWESIRDLEQEVMKRFGAKQALFQLPIANGSRLSLLIEHTRLNVNDLRNFLQRHLGRQLELRVFEPRPSVLNEISLTPGKDQRSAFYLWTRTAS